MDADNAVRSHPVGYFDQRMGADPQSSLNAQHMVDGTDDQAGMTDMALRMIMLAHAKGVRRRLERI